MAKKLIALSVGAFSCLGDRVPYLPEINNKDWNKRDGKKTSLNYYYIEFCKD